MSLNTQSILDVVVSHAMASGYFDKVNAHEPKSAPGSGVTCGVWVEGIDPVARASGLSVTSARLTLFVRIYQPMLMEPQDAIDPNVAAAADALMGAYTDDFSLGGTARNVDLLGQFGVALAARAGYLNLGGTLMRVVTITVPIIVNDVWSQEA